MRGRVNGGSCGAAAGGGWEGESRQSQSDPGTGTPGAFGSRARTPLPPPGELATTVLDMWLQHPAPPPTKMAQQSPRSHYHVLVGECPRFPSPLPTRPLSCSHLAGRAAALRLPRGMMVAAGLGQTQSETRWQRFCLGDECGTNKLRGCQGAGLRGHAPRGSSQASHLRAGLRDLSLLASPPSQLEMLPCFLPASGPSCVGTGVTDQCCRVPRAYGGATDQVL